MFFIETSERGRIVPWCLTQLKRTFITQVELHTLRLLHTDRTKFPQRFVRLTQRVPSIMPTPMQ